MCNEPRGHPGLFLARAQPLRGANFSLSRSLYRFVTKSPRIAAIAAALLIALTLALVGCGRESSSPEPAAALPEGTPVILISVDTLRSDRLPMYGYERIETPALEGLRADSILFEHAYSTVPLTLPSHSSILTGMDPDHHGVRSNVGYVLKPEDASLPRVLAGRGYETGAAVSAWVLRKETGVGAHFDFYDDDVGSATGISFANVQRPGAESAKIATNWILQRSDKPFFFMLHLFEPHMPFEPPADLQGRYQEPYDGEIVDADRIIGAFLDRLKQAGIYDRALIIFLSDHGEGLGDHGELGHGIFLYRESIQVPLLIKLPGSARGGETVEEPVSLTDLAPTVLGALDVSIPDSMKGANVLGSLDAERPIYSETLYPRLHLGWSELRSIISGENHYIEAPRPELYDIRADPAETENLLSDRRRVYARLRELLDDRPLALSDPSSVDREEAAKLAALGYLGSTVTTGDGELPDPKDKIGDMEELIEAMALASSADHRGAIDRFRKILEKNPALVEGWLQLGRLLDEEGRWPESLEAYREAMKLAPTSSGETALSIAEVLVRMERYDEALKHVELGEAINPARAGVIRARIALAEGDLQLAARLARAVPPGVQRDEADVVLAWILVESGDLEEAMHVVEEAAKRAAQREEKPPEGLLFVRGDILARMDRLDEAIKSFEMEITLYPGHLQAYGNLAVVNLLRGNRERVRDIMAAMVRSNPNERARAFAAHTLHELGDDNAAAQYE